MKFNIYVHYINIFIGNPVGNPLDNLFDNDILDKIYNEKVETLADLLLQTNEKCRINYQNFVIKCIDEI